MGQIERFTTSFMWRYRLWAWGDWLRVGGKIVRRDPNLISPYVAKLMALGRYEKPERDLLAHMHAHGFIARGDRVIEAGGGLGTITMAIADIVGDDAVFAFEPNPQTARALMDNLTLNGHRVAIENAALVAGEQKEIAFAAPADATNFAIGSTHSPERGATITVRAEQLSALLRRLEPTVLVLDVEGAEYDLLRSVDDWARIRAIHLEYHPDILSPGQIGEMFAHLEARGFARQPVADLGSHLALFVRQT
jgi:FkbM family methyltransferase